LYIKTRQGFVLKFSGAIRQSSLKPVEGLQFVCIWPLLFALLMVCVRPVYALGSDVKLWSVTQICESALAWGVPAKWETGYGFQSFVEEAQRRQLTTDYCLQVVGSTNTVPVVANKGRKSSAVPNATRTDGHRAANKYAVAVIIGNKAYEGRLPAVDFAHNDADAVKRYVRDVLGYDDDNIIDLRDASKAKMETAFGNDRSHEGRLWRYLDPKGRSDVLVFYSGHGVPGLKDRRGYLLPVDADPEVPEINGYPLETLFRNLARLEARSITVFLDACFSGQSQKGSLVQSASGLMITPKMPKKSISRMSVITASRGDQIASWDEKARHGLFTRHLLDALYGEADKEDYGNGDSKVTLAEVREYLDDKMTRAARRTYGRHQNAWVSGRDNVVLAAVTGHRREGAPAKPAARVPVAQQQTASVVQPQPVAPARPGEDVPLSSEAMLRSLDDGKVCKWATNIRAGQAIWVQAVGSSKKYVDAAFARNLSLRDCSRLLGLEGGLASLKTNPEILSDSYKLSLECSKGTYWRWTVTALNGGFRSDGERTSDDGKSYWWDIEGRLNPRDGLTLDGQVKFTGRSDIVRVSGKGTKVANDYQGTGSFTTPGSAYTRPFWSNCNLTAKRQ
jgi:hypothetical protein